MSVVSLGVVPSIPPLSDLSDSELAGILEDAQETSSWFGDDRTRGVIVAAVNTGGWTSGEVTALRTVWSLGEPAAEQDLALGIAFSSARCTVTIPG